MDFVEDFIKTISSIEHFSTQIYKCSYELEFVEV